MSDSLVDMLRQTGDRIIKILDEKLDQEREIQNNPKLSRKRRQESVEREIKYLVDKRGLLARSRGHLESTIDNCRDFTLSNEEWEKVTNKTKQ